MLAGTGLVLSCKSLVPAGHSAQSLPISNIAYDSAAVRYYRPYKDSLDKIMEVQLAVLEQDLSKQQPESTLGNMMVDILRIKTAQYTGRTMDLGVVNYGGIRIPALAKGPLKVLNAYNLMPFDNYLVTMSLSGQQVQALCDSIARKKGWPVSGVTFGIKQGYAVQVLVQGQPLDPAKQYQVALSDYLAGGGDGLTFLKDIPYEQTGVLFRDAILEYWTEQQAAGKSVTARLEKRIIYVE